MSDILNRTCSKSQFILQRLRLITLATKSDTDITQNQKAVSNVLFEIGETIATW